MEKQANEKADRLMNVEADEPASQQIADLNLTDAEANEIKGGPLCHGTTVLAWARVDGASSNHNETVAADEDGEAEMVLSPALSDLAMSADQSEEVKGGFTLIQLLDPRPGRN